MTVWTGIKGMETNKYFSNLSSRSYNNLCVCTPAVSLLIQCIDCVTSNKNGLTGCPGGPAVWDGCHVAATSLV